MGSEELWEVLLARIQEKTMAEWMEIFMADANIGVEPFRHTQNGMDHPQMRYNGHVIEVDDPEVGKTLQVGPLVDFSETPARVQGPTPRLGQQTEEVLSHLDGARRPVAPKDGHLPRHALDGVTVLELAGYWAAPFGTSLLADLGARVIKIEPLEGEPMRHLGVDAKVVQGKESLALDMRSDEGREILHKLVERADLFMHNYRPGVPERLGMDYDTLKKINPRLVYVYAGAYGSSGPYALRPAYHPSFGAICGEVLYQAGEGSPPPPGTPLTMEEVKAISKRLSRANQNSDPNSGLALATALLMGLYARERTGKGQYIERTMLCANAYASSDDFIRYEGKPPRRLPDPGLHGLGALYHLYLCREGWVFLACLAQDEWESLCRALAREDLLLDVRFATSVARIQHDAELMALLEEVFLERRAHQWEEYLSSHDVACVVADSGQYYAFFNGDSHIGANAMAVEVEHPVYGKYKRHAPLVALSLTPGIVGPGNRVGEHTRAILGELGYTTAEMDQFKEKAITTWSQ
jgi:crotonobetainyl-CoA:carnitine CoA-transferase CaiB-like acyl-CoA transferase